jgi:hypothetical protein
MIRLEMDEAGRADLLEMLVEVETARREERLRLSNAKLSRDVHTAASTALTARVMAVLDLIDKVISLKEAA